MKFSYILLSLLLLGSTSISYVNYTELRQVDVTYIEQLSSLYADRLANEITQAISDTEFLDEAILLADGNLSENGLSILFELVVDKSTASSIIFMPDGIATYAYPYEKNASVIGHNVLEDPYTSENAYETLQSNQTTVSGPYYLVQGYNGIVIRNPVFLDSGDFWGFITIIIDTSEALFEKIGIYDLEDLGYKCHIDTIYNGDTVSLYTSPDYDNPYDDHKNTFEIANSHWDISIYKPDTNNEIFRDTYIQFIAFISISFLIFIIVRNLEKKHSETQSQSITDSLTGLKNRKALDLLILKKSKWENGFTVFYIDLNKFKPVNDTFGHDTGDELLKLFSNRISGHFKKDTFISRVGGDEFVIIIFETLTAPVCEDIVSRIVAISEDPFIVDKNEILISSSIGYSRYPLDGSDFNDVLKSADKNMFEYKSKYKKGR